MIGERTPEAMAGLWFLLGAIVGFVIGAIVGPVM